MNVIFERKEIHLCNPSLEEIVLALETRDMIPDFQGFKIMIDEFDEETTSGW